MKCAGALVLAIAACGSPRPVRREAVVPKPTAPVSTGNATAPAPIAHKPRGVIEAPHAGEIQLLTATPEGDVVLSLDDLGAMRLWPSLDGTREPKVVDLPPAKELALGRRADGFLAVVRDETGGLYIAKLDADGRTLSHVTLGVDPPFSGIAMSTAGLIAWRSDHRVLLVGDDGTTKVDLPAEPQQRVIDISVQGAKAVALLEAEGRRRARWLTLQPRLAWGAWIDHPDHGTHGLGIALAPGHTQIAVATRDATAGQVAVYDITTGKLLNAAPIAATEIDLAFADDNLLALANANGGLQWLVVKENTPIASAAVPGQPARQRQLLAVGGGRVILAANGELVLMTPTTTQYLGYGAVTPQISASGPDGKLLVIGAEQAVLLDTNLREVSRPELGVTRGFPVAAVEWVGGDEWLIESSKKNGKLQLDLINASTGTSTTVRDSLEEVHYLGYEPSTKLVTLSFGKHAQVARLDVAKRTLDPIALAPKRAPYEEIAYAPLAPAHARGHQIVEISVTDRPVIRWFKSPAQLDKPSASVAIDGGAYLGTDAAGHVYAWRTTAGDQLVLTIYTDGKQTGTLPTAGAASLWPDPAGARVVEAGVHAVTLYRDGGAVWSRQVQGVQEALWLSDGALALTHASGVTRLDPATGIMTAARCGWDFGLTTKPHPIAPRIEPICAQLGR